MSAGSDDIDTFPAFESARDRALFFFPGSLNAFRHAEDIRYTGEYRKGRMRDGFPGPVDLPVSRGHQHVFEFEKKITDYCRTGGKIKVGIFNRIRSGLEYDAVDPVKL